MYSSMVLFFKVECALLSCRNHGVVLKPVDTSHICMTFWKRCFESNFEVRTFFYWSSLNV